MNKYFKDTIMQLLVGAALLGMTSLANAQTAFVGIYDGVNPFIPTFDNEPAGGSLFNFGDSDPSVGAISTSGNVGVWYNFTVTATTMPALGNATTPEMDLHITGDSSAAGSLRVTFSDNYFGPFSGNLNLGLSGTVSEGSATASFDVWGDPGNVNGATTVHIGDIGAGVYNEPELVLPASETASGNVEMPSPYSLTEVVTINADSPTDFSVDASFPVPLASAPDGGMTLAMLAMSLAAVETLRRKKAREFSAS